MTDNQKTSAELPSTKTSEQPVPDSREANAHEAAHVHAEPAGHTTFKDSNTHANSAMNHAATSQASTDERPNSEADSTKENSAPTPEA